MPEEKNFNIDEFQTLSEVDVQLYEEVMTAFERVIDPELGVDIVNLGLIYDTLYDGNGRLWVKMTLTTMGCPLQDIIMSEINHAIAPIDKIDDLKLELIWVPAWTTDRLTRYARIALGIR